MRKVLSIFLIVFALHMYAQNANNWDDPYAKSGSPGFEYASKGNYYESIGDINNAIIWYEKAVKAGNLFAAQALGFMYLNNKSIQNAQKAIGYFAIGIEKDYAPCLWGGYYVFSGKYGVPANPSLALDYCKRAANKGYYFAQRELGKQYLYGSERNISKGIEILEKMAKNGDIDCQLELGTWYSRFAEPHDYQAAIKWYSMSVEKGSPLGCLYLSLIYANIEEVQDLDKANDLARKAERYLDLDNSLGADNKVIWLGNCLSLRGLINMKKGNDDKAILIWKELKEKYPQFVEISKNNSDNDFVIAMLEKEKKETEVKQNIIADVNETNSNTNISSIISDVDESIPENAVAGTPVFAVIIANEKYNEVENVPYAIHDGETFMNYCEKTLGIPHSNIKFVADATLNNIKRQLSWLGQVMDVYQGEASIIFYYAGHGIPNESNGSAYLLPVDGYGTDVTTGYSLDKLYEELSSKPAKSVVVLLDACFSGAKRDGGMLASARGVAIKAKQNAPKGNMVVLSAAQGDETAYPYKEKGHGMFTYYLLKKLQETQGNVSFGELADYVINEVKKQSVIINGKMQTPLVSPSGNATDWQSWRLR